jgi:hypothetical protein
MRALDKISVLLPLAAGLCACAGGGAGYPSLAMRPFETAPPATPEPAPAGPNRPLADAGQLTRLVDRALAANTAFFRQQSAAARLARGAARQPLESNARAAALVAMAELAVQRAATSDVLAELDRLVAESAASLAPVEEIAAARARVLALVEAQDTVMARLWEELGQ